MEEQAEAAPVEPTTGPPAEPIAYILKSDLDAWVKDDTKPVRLYRVAQRDDAGMGDLYEQCALRATLVSEPRSAAPSVAERTKEAPTDEQICAWVDSFIRKKAFNYSVAVQIATEAAKWVRGGKWTG